MSKQYWFHRKRYGWGWMPASKEGWAVTLLAVVLGILFATRLETNPIQNGIYLFLIAVALVVVCYVKGEKPRWQWGKT